MSGVVEDSSFDIKTSLGASMNISKDKIKSITFKNK